MTKTNRPTPREAIESTRVYRRMADRLADHLQRRKIGYNDDDIYAVVMYVSGPQQCQHYDRLTDWAKMIVETLPSENDMRSIPKTEASS